MYTHLFIPGSENNWISMKFPCPMAPCENARLQQLSNPYETARPSNHPADFWKNDHFFSHGKSINKKSPGCNSFKPKKLPPKRLFVWKTPSWGTLFQGRYPNSCHPLQKNKRGFENHDVVWSCQNNESGKPFPKGSVKSAKCSWVSRHVMTFKFHAKPWLSCWLNQPLWNIRSSNRIISPTKGRTNFKKIVEVVSTTTWLIGFVFFTQKIATPIENPPEMPRLLERQGSECFKLAPRFKMASPFLEELPAVRNFSKQRWISWRFSWFERKKGIICRLREKNSIKS